MGRIPALVDGDRVMFESAAICLHLADKHPESCLAPSVATDERGHLYKWLVFLTNTIQPNFMAFYYPTQYTSDSADAGAVKASAEARLNSAYAVVDAALERGGPFLFGENLSVADFYLLMLMLVWWGRALRHPPAALPAVHRCVDLVARRPSVGRAAAAEGLEIVI